jgi:hypothetical protein
MHHAPQIELRREARELKTMGYYSRERQNASAAKNVNPPNRATTEAASEAARLYNAIRQKAQTPLI